MKDHAINHCFTFDAFLNQEILDLLGINKNIEPKYKIAIQSKYRSFKGDKSKVKYVRWREKIKDKRFARPIFIMHEKLEMIVNQSDIKINK